MKKSLLAMVAALSLGLGGGAQAADTVKIGIALGDLGA